MCSNKLRVGVAIFGLIIFSIAFERLYNNFTPFNENLFWVAGAILFVSNLWFHVYDWIYDR